MPTSRTAQIRHQSSLPEHDTNTAMGTWVALVSLSLILGGCKGSPKEGGAKGSGSGSSGSEAGSGDTAGASGSTTSATTAAVGDLKPVTECPPALRDTDRGLARTIPAGCTTVIEGEYGVEGTLTIEAGATLRFKPDSALFIGFGGPSKLVVRGTKDKPVSFVSAGDRAPGAWRGVHLYDKAARSEIVGLVVEHATIGLEIDSVDVTVKDCVFRETKELGVRVSDAATLTELSGTAFDKPGALAMSIPPSAMIAIANNTVNGDAPIQLRDGSASTSGTWRNPGAPVRVTGEVYIEGKSSKSTIEIAAGTTFKLESGGAFYVGYGGEGEVKLTGSAEAPVTFSSAQDAMPGAWGAGFIVYRQGALTASYAVFEHGGRENGGALRAEGGGKLSVMSSRFKNNVVGVTVDEPSELRAFDQNTFETNQEAALVVSPKHVGVLGAANTYRDQRILIHAGKIEKSATWVVQNGAQVVIDGEVYVEGGAVLTLPEGAKYRFTDAAQLFVGYGGPGTLVANGTSAAPILFAGAREDEGSWKGIELFGSSINSKLDHVSIENADVGVRVAANGVVSIDTLSCTNCKDAALRWDCAAKVTQKAVTATKGAAKGAVPPEGC